MDRLTPTQCKMARAGLGLTVEQLALFAKVSPTTISNFERNKGSFTERTRDKILKSLRRLGVDFNVKFSLENTKKFYPNYQGLMISYDHHLINSIYENIIKHGYSIHNYWENSSRLFFPPNTGKSPELSNLIIAHSDCNPIFDYKSDNKISISIKKNFFDKDHGFARQVYADYFIFYDNKFIDNKRLDIIHREYLVFIHAEEHDPDLIP